MANFQKLYFHMPSSCWKWWILKNLAKWDKFRNEFKLSFAKYDWWILTQRDLAAAMKRVIANETEYLSYFWWKDFYRNVNFHPYAGKLFDYQIMKAMLSLYRVETNMKFNAFCQLCKMLNDSNEPVKVRDHLKAWWKTGGNCKVKGSHPWSKYR